MKKLRNIICLFVMTLVLALPLKANALSANFTGVNDKCQTPDSEGYCTATVYLKLKLSSAGETWEKVSGQITLKDTKAASKIKDFEITAEDGVTITAPGAVSTGYVLSITNNGIKLSTDKFTNAVKVTYKHHQSLAADGIDCGLKFTTKEETVETPTETNTKTGASLPYAILGVAAVGALSIYLVTSKKSKIRNV